MGSKTLVSSIKFQLARSAIRGVSDIESIITNALFIMIAASFHHSPLHNARTTSDLNMLLTKPLVVPPDLSTLTPIPNIN